MPTSPDPTPRRWRRWILAAAMGAALVWLTVHRHDVQDALRRALETMAALGPWGPILFIALYVAAAVLLAPGSVLTLGAGAAFGLVMGSVYVSVGSTLGATCAFLVGRHLARPLVARRLQAHPRFAALDAAVAAEGWKIVGLARLSPVLPFNLLNYAFGLTRVRLGHYVLASWIGMMPGTVMYVYLGSLVHTAVGDRPKSPAEWTLYAVGLAATIAVTVLVTRLARRALSRRIGA